MVQKNQAVKLAFAFLALLAPFFAQAQTEQKDSLVRLIQATSLEQKEVDGNPMRKAFNATFLHNGTYLICDSALWNVDKKVINCQGHVQLMQDETVLTSDRLDYLIDEDLAQFRGSVVQLRNKKENILRTRNLDYNTKDSVAIFTGGAAMRDADGQIIESDRGTYESSAQLFTFNGNVNMFTDSVFVKTTSMTYDSDRSQANFTAYIDFWKDGYMLSSNKGWYNRGSETFFFRDCVHALSEDQEVWCDTLYYYRGRNDVNLLGRAQVQDTTRNVYALADYIFYQDTLSRVTLRKRAAVAIRTEQDDQVDTLYCGADTLVYHTVKRCDIPENLVKEAVARLEEIMADPVSAYRRKAAEEAAKAAELAKEEKMKAANPRARARQAAKDAQDKTEETPEPSAAEQLPQSDTLSAPVDTVAPPPPEPDTSKVGFLRGRGHVKMFRKDLQVSCDSLLYNDLDSIARFFIDPIIWNEGNRQYTSDSLFVLVRKGGVDRASLMSNAFILTQETENYYDQIKGTDVMAFFDSTSALRRFDALGGATALFYLQENEEYATVNKVDSKMLSATLKDGSVERVFYFDNPKNDAYPIAQLPKSEARMKGFNWQPEKRPKSKDDITPLVIRPSERSFYERKPHATFTQTDIYFPGYMNDVYKSIDASKERARIRREREAAERDSLAAAKQQAADVQVLAVQDSLATMPFDTLAAPIAKADSIVAAAPAVDSVAVSLPRELTKQELRAKERQEKKEAAELARQLRIAERDARWAELDARDAAKAEAKAQRKQQKADARAERLRKRQEKQAARDQKKLDRFIEYYQKQKDRHDGKQKPEPEAD